MKAKDLIKILETDPERLVVLSCDEEGNRYSEWDGFSSKMKYEDGEIGLEKLTPEDEQRGYSDEDVMRGGKKAFVLYPK